MAVETTALTPAAVCVSLVGRDLTALSQNARISARTKADVRMASVSALMASVVRTVELNCALLIVGRMGNALMGLASVRRATSARTAV